MVEQNDRKEYLKSQRISTPDGELTIEGPVLSEQLAELSMDEELRAFRPPKKQKEALLEISKLPEGRIILARIESRVMGYVTFHPPDSFERWSTGPAETLELGAIEVSPKVRHYGVGGKLLQVAFSDPVMENYLVIATEYYWHWDLERTGLPISEYRELMCRLMAPVGMTVVETDEEEICAHPANMLMARYGKNLTLSSIQQFKDILFIKPESTRR